MYSKSFRNGETIFYYENGQVFEKCNWIMGRSDGRFTVCFKSGAVKMKGKYKLREVEEAFISFEDS